MKGWASPLAPPVASVPHYQRTRVTHSSVQSTNIFYVQKGHLLEDPT